MTIASEIQRVQTNIANAYTSLEAKGATMPSTRNSANLASTIDSVSSTGGNTVQAYALGDAKNTAEGDKVLLNYSADILTREESVSIEGVYDTKAYYLTPVQKGIFFKYVSNRAYFYRKDITKGWVKISEYQYDTLYPFVTIGEKGFVSTGWRSFKPFAIDELGAITALPYYDSSNYVYLYTLSCSDDNNVILQPSTNYSDAPMSVYRFVNGKYVYNQLPRKTTGYDMYILPGGDGQYYPVADESTKKIWKYDIETNTFVEEIGTGNGNFGGVSYEGFRITIDNFSTSSGTEGGAPTVRDLSWDGTTWTTTTNSLLTNQLRSVLGSVSARIICVRKWKDELVFTAYPGDKNIRIRYNEERGMFEEPASAFVDKASPYSVSYGDEDAAAYVSSSTTCILRNVGIPPEESYVAIQPNVRDQISPTTTLTGFVKENDNGVLKVSTVVDPKAVVPTSPDEYGLKTTVKYGGDVIINPNLVIASDITKTGTNLSGFTKNNNCSIITNSPFISLSSVSFFDIVMCATHPADGGYYHWLAGLTDNANAYRGFDIRTEGNNFLEALIYHEDGTSTYLKSETTLPTNAKTFIKLSYNSSSGYTMSFSSDGVSYTQVASVTTAKPMELTPPTLYLGWRPPKQQSTYYWNGTIHLEDCFINVNGTKIWSGVTIDFGSVAIGHGYFRNTLTKPSDKYIEYDGGILNKDDVLSFEGYTLTPAVYRKTDLGDWTSETEAALLGVGSQITGMVKRLEPTVYLWHDLSYITPVVPETLEPEVKVSVGGNVPNGNIVGSLTVSDDLVVSNFSTSNYLEMPTSVIPSGSEPWTFVTKFNCTSVSSEQGIIGYRGGGLFRIAINSSKLRLDLSTNNSSWNIGSIEGTTTLSNNTDYWVKAEFTGSAYNLYLSTDGQAYSIQGTLNTSSVPTWPSVLTYGIMNSFAFNGSLYLQEAYFEKGGIRVWDGAVQDYGTVSLPASWKTLDGVVYEYPKGFPKTQADAITVKPSRLNVDIIGSPVVSSLSGDAYGFTTSDFLRVPYEYWKEDLSAPGSGFDIDIALFVDAQGNPGQYVLGGSTSNAPISLGFTSAGNMEVDVYCSSENTKTFRMSYVGAIEVGNRYTFRIGYNTFAGYYVTRSTNNGEPETLVTNSTTIPPYMDSTSELWLGRAANNYAATGLVVHLADCAIYVNGEKKWEGLDTDMTIGEPALYATKTGDSCSLAISTKAPKGVDSSVVLGTVELDSNGAIVSYTPNE